MNKRNQPPATYNRRRLRELPIPRIEQKFIPDPNDTLNELFSNASSNASEQNIDENGGASGGESLRENLMPNTEELAEENPLHSPYLTPMPSPIQGSESDELADEEQKPDMMPIRRISFASYESFYDIAFDQTNQSLEESTQATASNNEIPSTSQMNVGTSASAQAVAAPVSGKNQYKRKRFFHNFY